ncbi:MAG: S-layer homology domain-containing protein, partial [Leptolyngbya sp.]|nr:S-layer homology domain-containing protein [Candidatus Melainabacteria bacterium]
MRLSKMKPAVVAAFFTLNTCLPVMAARFVDVPGNWAEKYINELSDKGVIPAEKDGKFKPKEPVTRAVLSMWMVRALGIENQPVSQKPSFPDVKTTDPFYKYVEIIRQNNYIAGFADGFRPNQFIQQGEVIAIVSRALGTAAPSESEIAKILARYQDGSKVPQWAREGVAQAAQNGLLDDDEKPNLVDATTIGTRAGAAALISKLKQYLARKDIEDTTKTAVQPPSSGYGATNVAPNAPPPQNQYGQQGNQSFQGRVSEQGYAPPPQMPPQNNGQPGYPQMQQTQIPPNNQYAGAAMAPQGYPPPMQQQYPQPGQFQQAAGNPYLAGRISVVEAGTKIQANLKNTLDSGSTQPGEPVEATLGSPLFANGVEVIPAGSKLIGQVTNVVSAKRFKFGANGKIDIRFTQVETPDGRKIPLSASVDDTHLRLTGGTTAGRVGKGLITTGVGAAGGAALGTALGAIVGATGRGQVGRSTGMGAAFGTALGGGVGA